MQIKRIRLLLDKKPRGQAMVEFAIALPVVLLIVFGIIEVGYLLFSYSSVNSAAREAARYGIAIGEVGADQRYYDCNGIVAAGLRIGRFAGMTSSDISISYDHGPKSDGTAPDVAFPTCDALATANGGNITFGDRIVVTVNHQYRPLISYMGLNITPFTMTSTSARTIFKDAEIIPGGGDTSAGGGGGGGGGGGECYTLTLTAVGGTAVAPSASPSPDCDGDNSRYAAGTTVTLTGNPDTAGGYHTYSWNGVDSIDATDNNIAYITMNADSTVTVNYSMDLLNCYSLPAPTHDGNGADPVVTNTSGSCGGGQFTDGETVNLLAAPDTGWMITGWTNATSTGDKTASFTMPAANDYQVTVHYLAVDCYGLDLQAGTVGGSAPVALSESPVCGPGEFMENEVVNLAAYPDTSYDVDYWEGATQSALDANQASFTMPAGVPTIIVYYKEEPTLDPPSNLNVPNDFAAGDFNWDDTGGGSCTSIEFYFADSMPPAGNWPSLPDYYNVTVIVDTAGGPVTSVYQVTSPQWTNGASVGMGYKISFGAEAVFLNNPSQTSMYAQVTYICYYQELKFDGYQAK